MRRLACVLVLVTGCMGSASIYYQDRGGGVLALHDDEDRAMKDAFTKMAAHCGPAGYQIVKRETFVVGQENYTDSRRSYGEDQASAHAKDTASVSHGEASYQGGSSTDVQSVDTSDQTRHGSVTISDTSVTHSAGGQSETTTSDASSTRSTKQTSIRGGEASSSVSGTRQVTETRVTYVCAGAVAPAPAPAPQPQPQ